MRRLFIGRLDKSTRPKDVEDLFEAYGRLDRCELKYGTDHGKEKRRYLADSLSWSNND